jgi:hypothetical protein
MDGLKARQPTPAELRRWRKSPPPTPLAYEYTARLARLRRVDVESLHAWRQPKRRWCQ